MWYTLSKFSPFWVLKQVFGARKISPEGQKSENLVPNIRKSTMGGYHLYLRHYRPHILVFPELLLSQNGFICSTNVIFGILGGPNGIKSESSWSTKAVGYLVYLTFEIKSYAVWDFQTTDNAMRGTVSPSPPLPSSPFYLWVPFGHTWAPQCHLSDPK